MEESNIIYIDQSVTREQDGRISSVLNVNKANLTTRYYDNASFLFVAVRALLNIVNTLPEHSKVELKTNIYNMSDILNPSYEMAMKTRYLLLETIEKKSISIQLI